jgi:predicted metalloprotease with PDZ domain
MKRKDAPRALKMVAPLAAAMLVLVCAATLAAQAPPGPVRIFVDASQVPGRKLFHTRMEFPVQPGPMELYYPEWLPGEHGPTGPIADLMGIQFTGNGKRIPWRRDIVQMYTFHLTIPAGVHTLVAELDYVNSAPPNGFSSGASASPHLAVLNWNQVLLYPAGYDFRKIMYDATLRIPVGWQYHTALPIGANMNTPANFVHFEPVPLNTLIDSPVQMGEYTRIIPLAEHPLHEIDIAADTPGELEMTPALIRDYKQLVAETGALWGSRHYRDYHFLLTLSDYVAHFGLEHHESSDDRTYGHMLTDPALTRASQTLLPHEFTHSWNGKYRRPIGLVDKNYQEPMKDNLLWVYEGLTQYVSFMLTARSGLCQPENCRELWAYTAASLNHRSGREWRPLQDTADSAPFLYAANKEWSNWRRTTDFYDEGALIWLEVDTKIRQLTHDRKSIDDFLRLFEGGPGGKPALEPYDFNDLVAALNQVAPYDWAKLLRTRLDAVGGRAPVEGILSSGWLIVYNDRPNLRQQTMEAANHEIDCTFTVGMTVGDNGTIKDFVRGRPAYESGLAPGMRILAINRIPWSPNALRDAIRNSASASGPIRITAQNDDQVRTYSVLYQGGLRYPHLRRIPDRPDLLGQILKQHAPSVE